MSSNRVRYVGGDTKKVAMKPDPNTNGIGAFNKGDLLFQYDSGFVSDARLVNGCVYPATVILNSATEAECQKAFARCFAGVADEKYGLQSGEFTFNLNKMQPLSVSVCTAGKFEFDCPSQTFLPNALVGIYAVAGGTGIPDAQKVDAVADAGNTSEMIGVVAQQEAPIESGVAMTRVVVDIMVPRPYATAPAAGTYSGTSGQ